MLDARTRRLFKNGLEAKFGGNMSTALVIILIFVLFAMYDNKNGEL